MMLPARTADLRAMALDPASPLLPAAQRTALLALVPEWSDTGDALARTFRFTDFEATMRFVNRIAALAGAANHHPRMEVTYDCCTVQWSTHSAGGITASDFICAARSDAASSDPATRSP